MKKNNLKNLSAGALEVLEVLKGSEPEITFAELKEGGLDGLNSAHLTALVRRGLVSAEMKQKEFTQVVKRKVNVYTITEKGLAEPESE